MLIVIDPGHGGEDPGAVCHGMIEKDITLKLARLVAAELATYQARVITTRDGDATVSLGARVNLANTEGADYFCSLHINAGGGSGFESYVHPDASKRTEELRRVIHQEVAKFCKASGFPDRGMKYANYAVLRETKMPSVLLENLFIDNSRDAAALKQEDFLQQLASAIARGLAAALGLPLASSPAWDPQGRSDGCESAG